MATRTKAPGKKAPPKPAAASLPPARRAPRKTILVVDDQPEVAEHLRELVEERSFAVVTVRSAEEGLERIAKGEAVDAVVLDLNLGAGRMGGMQALPRFLAARGGLPVLMLTGEGSTEKAVEAMRKGATDFIPKGPAMEDDIAVALARLERILGLVRESTAQLQETVTRLEDANSYLREELYKKYRIVGSSAAVRKVVEQIEQVAMIPRPVLIRGERGTGKELVAAAIHKASPRAAGPFVTINCAAFAEGLLECEMFGQEEGGYTDAKFRKGRFELAHKGTLFLDEVGNMPLKFQQKMLRVLEYQEFSRVGGSATIKVDVRVVAATNADLETLMAKGEFREDLYDRLSFETLQLPPLRERRDDLPALTQHFLSILALDAPGAVPERFSPEAMKLLQENDWPGNVREFKNYVERVAYRVKAPVVEVDHLLPLGSKGESWFDVPGATLREKLDHVERRILRATLASARGDRKRAAEALGLAPGELAGKLEYHQID